MNAEEMREAVYAVAGATSVDLSGWTLVLDALGGSHVTPHSRILTLDCWYMSDAPAPARTHTILHELRHVHQVNSGRFSVDSDSTMVWDGVEVHPRFPGGGLEDLVRYCSTPWEEDAIVFSYDALPLDPIDHSRDSMWCQALTYLRVRGSLPRCIMPGTGRPLTPTRF